MDESPKPRLGRVPFFSRFSADRAARDAEKAVGELDVEVQKGVAGVLKTCVASADIKTMLVEARNALHRLKPEERKEIEARLESVESRLASIAGACAVLQSGEKKPKGSA
jgi:hypothetical protein